MRRYRPWLAGLLVAAAALSWWLRDVPPPPPPASPAMERQGAREIDYYITGLDVTRMTQAGIPAHRLRAARAQHFTDDDTTQLTAPRLTVYQGQAPPWEVDAEGALVSADGDLILLSGAVLIERAGDADNRPMRIVTRELRVQPRQDYAETDEKVRVESDTDWLDASGMQAWLRPPSRLKFLSRVRGYYVPPSN
ncbi:MAG: LPS export ABC transporter periplasmic protein LptC [Gammaproteobacteria bacterium]|nr:LPS export ABC transporter periplasmic protein LptC [Gammaproteobacteria bacterium]